MFLPLCNSVLTRLFASLTKQHNLFYTLKKLIPIKTWDFVKSPTFCLLQFDCFSIYILKNTHKRLLIQQKLLLLCCFFVE